MDNRTRRIATEIYDHGGAVLAVVAVASLLGIVFAASGVLDPTRAGLLGGLAWALAGFHLEYRHPSREDVPGGLLAIFYLVGATISGTSVVGLPEFWVGLIQTAAYMGIGALSIALFLVVQRVLDDPESVIGELLE